MAECDNSAVISENPPGMDSTYMMDTSWNVSSSSRKRAPKPALRNDKKFMKSTDSLVDVTNRFDGLTDKEEGEVLGPSTKVLSTPPPKPAKRQSLTSAQAPVLECHLSPSNGISPAFDQRLLAVGRVSRASNHHSKGSNGNNNKGPHVNTDRNPDRHKIINSADPMKCVRILLLIILTQ
jgi:hypothetical protein